MFQVNVISSVINFVSLKQISDKFNRFFNDLDNFNWKNKPYLEKSDSIEKGKQRPEVVFLVSLRTSSFPTGNKVYGTSIDSSFLAGN